MQVVKTKDSTRTCGEAQGFFALHLIDEVNEVEGIGPVAMMTSVWKPTIDEVMALLNGATIRIRLWGIPNPETGVPNPAPMAVWIGEPD